MDKQHFLTSYQQIKEANEKIIWVNTYLKGDIKSPFSLHPEKVFVSSNG